MNAIGLATLDAVNAMEEGISLAQGPSSYIFLGQRLIQGWAVELVLVAMLLPFIAAAVDLFARCRRRRIPISPAFRSYRSRLAFWGLGGLVFLLFGAAGFLGTSNGRPAPLNDARWPIGALLVLALLGVASWLVVRDRLTPRRAIETEEELAGYTAALLALAVVGLLVAATNPYALIFLLPCLHFWLWLPQVQARTRGVRARRPGARPHRPGVSRLDVRDPVRARLGCAVVHRAALRGRLRAANAVRDRARGTRSRRPAVRPRGQPLRAVSRSGRGPAARSAPRFDPHARSCAATTRRAHGEFRRSQETPAPVVSSPFPRGTWTSASAALALAIMCDS